MTVFLAQIFKRRSQMAWDEFDEFKEDAFFVAFVEIAFIEGSENNFFAGCSCSHGTKGRNCVHTLGAYMQSGVLELPSRMPRLARNHGQRGRIPNAKKMSRFY